MFLFITVIVVAVVLVMIRYITAHDLMKLYSETQYRGTSQDAREMYEYHIQKKQ
jgi:hypothetical protein